MAFDGAYHGFYQLAWDSTSLTAFKKCPRFYYYSILCGWRPLSDSPHLKFGILFHSALEAFDKITISREFTDEDLFEIIRATLEAAGRRTEGEGKFIPWWSDHPAKNIESLIRSIVFYVEQYRNDAAKTVVLANGKAAVELSFRYELPISVLGQSAQYSGHMDKLVEFAGQRFVLDRKTTGSYLGEKFFGGFSPHLQFTGYIFAGGVCLSEPLDGGIVDAAQIGAGFTRFGRGFVNRTSGQLEEWLTDTCLAIKLAEQYAREEYWPMNETACGNYGGCQFQGVCGKAPGVRENFLKAGFRQERWDPLASRNIGD